jgi:type IV pilus assembly protein PilB
MGGFFDIYLLGCHAKNSSFPTPNNRGETMTQEHLGGLLVREKLITPVQLRNAVQGARESGRSVTGELCRRGVLDENALAQFLARQFSVPIINLGECEVDSSVIRLISAETARRRRIIPVARNGNKITLAMMNPGDMALVDEVRFATGLQVDPVVVSTESAMDEALEKYYAPNASFDEAMEAFDLDQDDLEEVEEPRDFEVADLERVAGAAPVVKLVNWVILEAVRHGASDIHIEAYERVSRIRLRIDGILYESLKTPPKLFPAIVSRLKVMSGLDIAEHRLPQDGRFRMRVAKGGEIDFRVSVYPTVNGEKVVLRLLDKSRLQLDMILLGLEPGALVDLKSALALPHGMVLITGPTGSGKTTTLYSALVELNKVARNVSTVEDPVEYKLFGINQGQINETVGFTFAAALRSLLRQDPDVIMVGEIRDFDTAEIAVKAAMTGHLVLSTLHTNDAPSSVGRLINMGVEPFLVAASVNLIGAQRLVRRLCPCCREKVEVPEKTLLDIGVPPAEVAGFAVMRGRGCKECKETGYKGRIAIYEIMPVTEELRELILNGASTAELKREAVRRGMKTLRMSAITKLGEGVTSLEEVVRNTAPD